MTKSPLVQKMACRLIAKPLPERMLGGILLIRTLETNFNEHKRNSYIFIQSNAFDNDVCDMSAILSRLQCVKAFKKCDIAAMEYASNSVIPAPFTQSLVLLENSICPVIGLNAYQVSNKIIEACVC